MLLAPITRLSCVPPPCTVSSLRRRNSKLARLTSSFRGYATEKQESPASAEYAGATGVLPDGSLELLPPADFPTNTSSIDAVVEQQKQQPQPSLLDVYGDALSKAPVRTKALTSLVGFVLGDICAQILTSGSVDIVRCLRLGAYGLLLDGPVGHMWYKILDAKVSPENPTHPAAILTKTALDQLIWAPAMTVVFFTFLRLSEGQPDLIISTLQSRVVPTLFANYVIWPFAHYASFRWVPTDYRILYNNIVSIAWITWLSMLAAGDISFDLHTVTIQAQHWAAVIMQHHTTPTLASAAADLGSLVHQILGASPVTHVHSLDNSALSSVPPLEVSYEALVKLSQSRFINNPPGPW